MIDERIVKALQHPDSEKRRQAVMLLAKTRDPEALKHLARVYREDADPAVRDLARKGGLYIKKHAPAAGSPPVTAAQRRAPLRDDMEADGDEDEAHRPQLMEQRVSESDRQTAKSYLEQAIDFNLRRENEKPFERLTRAFALNPRLESDGDAMNVAATVTGLDPQTAYERIQQAIEESPKLKKGQRARRKQRSASATLIAVAALMLGVLILLGYFLPWFDMSNLRDESGQTMRQSMNGMQEIMGFMFGMADGQEEVDPALQQFNDSIQGLRLSFNGLDATLIAVGLRDPLDVLGIQAFMDTMMDMMGMDELFGELMGEMEAEIEHEPLDYTLPLVPLAGVVALLMGVALLNGTGMVTRFIGVTIGLVTILPILHYFLSLAEEIAQQDIDITGEMAGSYSTIDYMGAGYWLSAVGVALFALVMIASVLFPSDAEAAG